MDSMYKSIMLVVFTVSFYGYLFYYLKIVTSVVSYCNICTLLGEESIC